MYAEHDGDVVRVDKELYGDVFRRSPKLTPLEARAIRLAIEYVGPTIAADAHTPLERVRKKLEETFGRFDLAGTPEPRDASDEEALVKVLSDGAEKRVVVEIEYLKEGDEAPSLRRVEPYTIERELPVWRVHTWDRTVDAARTFRLDRMRSARLTDEQLRVARRLRPLVPPKPAGRAPPPFACHRAVEARTRCAARSPTARRFRTCRTRPRTGSSPRCSPTAARRRFSSRSDCAISSRSARDELQRELGRVPSRR